MKPSISLKTQKNGYISKVKAPENTVMTLNFTSQSMSAKRDIDMDKLGINVEGLPTAMKKVWKVDCIPVDLFQPFNMLRQRAAAKCHINAAKTELGFITVKSRSIDVFEELEVIKKEWYNEKEKVLKSYDLVRVQHLDRLEKELLEPSLTKSGELIRRGMSPQDAKVLREAVERTQPSLGYIGVRLSFDFHGIPLALNEDDFDVDTYTAQRNLVVSLKNSTMGALIKDVCTTATLINETISKVERNAKNNQDIRIHGKTVKSVNELCEKLYDLSFIHENVKTVHDCIRRVLNDLPHVDQALRGQNYAHFKILIGALTDQHELAANLLAKTPIIIFNDGTTAPTPDLVQEIAPVISSEEVVDDSLVEESIALNVEYEVIIEDEPEEDLVILDSALVEQNNEDFLMGFMG